MDPQAGSARLGEPIVDDGIRWSNFFNGRVLSGEDLRADQVAVGRARRQLGRAVGSGVVDGLAVEVDASSSQARPVLGVDPGLAIDLDGRAVELRRRVRVGLVRVDIPTDVAGADFARCDVVLPGTTGQGAYVLTVGASEADSGRAPVAGPGASSAACSTAWSVEGVRFRLFAVDLGGLDIDAPTLRNLLAARMFGQGDPRDRSIMDPMGARPGATTGLDDLRIGCFGPAEVPIALLTWLPGTGIRFLDPWSVRRRAAAPSGATSVLVPADDAHVAAHEARLLQFQDHVADLVRTESDPAAIVAADRFRYLPPAGVLPLRTAGQRGYDPTRFFFGMPTRGPVFLEGAQVVSILRESFGYPAIDLAERTAIWLYLVRENATATPATLRIPGTGPADLAVPAGPLTLGHLLVGRLRPTTFEANATYLLFSTAHMRYRADARFDLAHQDAASFAAVD
jgi:hypothetical protein